MIRVKVFRFEAESYNDSGAPIKTSDLKMPKDIEEHINRFIFNNAEKVIDFQMSLVPTVYPNGGTRTVQVYAHLVYEEIAK